MIPNMRFHVIFIEPFTAAGLSSASQLTDSTQSAGSSFIGSSTSPTVLKYVSKSLRAATAERKIGAGFKAIKMGML